MKKIFLLSLLLALMVSCQDYEELNLQSGRQLVSLTGTVVSTPDDAQTRSAYDEFTADRNTYTGIYTHEYFWPGWEALDTLGAFDGNHCNAPYAYSPAKELFLGSVATGMRLVYNYYPYRKGTFAPTEVPAYIDSVQCFSTQADYYHKYDIYAGEPRYTGYVEGTEAYGFAMYRPTSLLRIGIDFSDIDTLATEEVENIRYEAQTPLSGDFTMDITRKYPTLQPTASAVNHVDVSFPDPQLLDKPVSGYVVTAPTVEMDDSLKLIVSTTNWIITIRTAALHRFQAGNSLLLYSIFDKQTLDRAGNTVTIEPNVKPGQITIQNGSGVVVSE